MEKLLSLETETVNYYPGRHLARLIRCDKTIRRFEEVLRSALLLRLWEDNKEKHDKSQIFYFLTGSVRLRSELALNLLNGTSLQDLQRFLYFSFHGAYPVVPSKTGCLKLTRCPPSTTLRTASVPSVADIKIPELT
jgi:hypothetical protein